MYDHVHAEYEYEAYLKKKFPTNSKRSTSSTTYMAFTDNHYNPTLIITNDNHQLCFDSFWFGSFASCPGPFASHPGCWWQF